MSAILSCTVSSAPATIEFRWVGPFELTADAIRLADSQVTTVDGLVQDLDGWTVLSVTQVPVPAGLVNRKFVADVLLKRGSRASYKPTTGSYFAFKFDFLTGSRSVRPEAHAIVDEPPGVGEGTANPPGSTSSPSAPTPPTPTGAGKSGSGGKGSSGAILTELQLLTGFPFQVYDGVGGGTTSPAPGGVAPMATGNAAAIVDGQMRAVLGRTPGTGGVAATLAALDRSFRLVDEDGNEVWAWQRQSYAVQSDIGAGVTGKQASLARLSASVADEIGPLVTGLRPLVPENTVNPDEIDAARAIFADSLPAFVTELGSDGGPRFSRAQGLLADVATQLQALGMLLGALGPLPTGPGIDLSNPTTWNPVFAFDQVGTWFQPDEFFVVTVDDEQNLTNYRIAFDRIGMLVAQFRTVYPTGAPLQDRGALIVLLQRALDASGEAAQAVYDSLDSVNLGPDEREVIIADPNTGLTVEDVISWAASFPTDEASELLQDGGKLGARSIETRATSLQSAVQLVTLLTAPPGITHPRVQFALTLLADALQDVVNAAAPLT